MENEDCKICASKIKDLEGRVLYQSNRIDKISNLQDEIKNGLHGDFKNNGLVARVTMLEAQYIKFSEKLDKTFNTLIGLTITIVGAIGIQILSNIFKK